MRSSKTQTFCPLLALLLSVVSCGKKATSSSEKDAGPVINNQVPTSNVVVELDTTKGKTALFTIQKSGSYTLPEFLKIKSGSLPGRKVTVTFDQNPSNPSDYSIQCTYVTSYSEPTIMDVETCYDIEGKDIGNYTTEVLPMHEKNLVKMELHGSYATAQIFAYFTAN